MNCFRCRQDVTSMDKHLVCFFCKATYRLTCLTHVKHADYEYVINIAVNWKCQPFERKKGSRGDNTPLTPVGQRSDFIFKTMGSDGVPEFNTVIKKMCNSCKKGFSQNVYKAVCVRCNLLYHFKCTVPVIVKDDYLKIKESWVCNMCVDDDNKINQALRSVAPSTAHTTDKPAAATSSLSTDGTDKASGVTLSDILNEMISFRKEVKETNHQFNCTLQKYSDWLEENAKKIEDVSNKLTVVSNNIETLFQENVNLKKKVYELTNKCFDLEQRELGNEVGIQGIPCEKGENIIVILEKISEVIGENI
ncbi:hypothetical protein J6590_023083 [Homalodisca vitripennis]|nr:hypothetical protein J6590_023083 [Homalodisca vitripennis]